MHRFSILLALALAVTCPIALAQNAPLESGHVHYAWANVTRVNPIYHTVQVANPRQQCYQQPVVRHGSSDNTAGTLLGAVIGGALANTVGHGDGRQAATVAGAVVGGVVGNRVASRDDRANQDSVTRCRQIQDVVRERRIVGYDVEYRYRGHVYLSRLDYDPGERVRVRVSVSPAN